MSYFNQIGKITYQGQDIDNFYFAYEIPEDYYNSGFFEPYIVQDGERIERISQKIYGDDTLYWIILKYNKIIDPYNELPITNLELEEMTKLQAINLYGVDYTEIQYQKLYDELSLENDSKRQIELPLRSTITKIQDDVDEFFRNQRNQ